MVCKMVGYWCGAFFPFDTVMVTLVVLIKIHVFGVQIISLIMQLIHSISLHFSKQLEVCLLGARSLCRSLLDVLPSGEDLFFSKGK